MSQILGFTPDADPAPPGVIVDCEMMLPYELGMRSSQTPISVGMPALDGEARGAFIGLELAGTRRLIAGTDEKLFQSSGSTWNDISRAGGYSIGAEGRWSFAQFGDSTLAATPSAKIQLSNPGGDFSDISTAPQAKIVVSLKGFVVAFATNEAIYGDNPDRWWCSAYLDASNWTPNLATQCATGRIVESGGGFTAAARYGDDFIAYKRNAMWLGRYAGAPSVWDFIQIASDVGCVGQEAVCDTGAGHIFVGSDDIYLYDGGRPTSIMTGKCRDWYVSNRDPASAFMTRILWDRYNSLAWIFFPSIYGGGTVDYGLVYHTKSGRWGRANIATKAVVVYASPAFTYDSGIPSIATYDTGPSIPYDSPFWNPGQELAAVFNADNVLQTISGRPKNSSFTTGDYGDEFRYSSCNALKVRYKLAPDNATATGYVKDDSGVVVSQVSTAIRDDAAFDIRQQGRWHRFKVNQAGPAELLAISPILQTKGRR